MAVNCSTWRYPILATTTMGTEMAHRQPQPWRISTAMEISRSSFRHSSTEWIFTRFLAQQRIACSGRQRAGARCEWVNRVRSRAFFRAVTTNNGSLQRLDSTDVTEPVGPGRRAAYQGWAPMRAQPSVGSEFESSSSSLDRALALWLGFELAALGVGLRVTRIKSCISNRSRGNSF